MDHVTAEEQHNGLECAAFTKPRCFYRCAAFSVVMLGCGIFYSLMVPLIRLLWVSHSFRLVFKQVLDLQLRCVCQCAAILASFMRFDIRSYALALWKGMLRFVLLCIPFFAQIFVTIRYLLLVRILLAHGFLMFAFVAFTGLCPFAMVALLHPIGRCKWKLKCRKCGLRRVCWKHRRKRIGPSVCTLSRLRLKLNQRRQGLRGGGGGLADALQKLLESHQNAEWEDRGEVWLRRKLESLLSKKQSNGTLMTGLRTILQKAEAWQTQVQAPATKASRWKASKVRSQPWEPSKPPPDQCQGPSTTGNAWHKSHINKKQSSRWQKEHSEEWHQVKWRPRPQEFGDPGKVRIFCDVVDLSDHLDLMNDQMLDHGDLHVVFHADDEHAAQEASDILHVVQV